MWVEDITYIPTDEGFAYTAIVKDLNKKKVVGYATGKRIDTNLVVDALKMAIRRENPPRECVFHSDRGSQYASRKYAHFLKLHGFQQSMSRKGDPFDNAVAESFFSTLKCELVHLAHFYTRDQVKQAIFAYIEGFYNTCRIQKALGWLSPMDFMRTCHQAA